MPGTGKTQPTRHSSRILGVSDGNMTSEVGLPRRRPGIEPHAQPHGRQGQVDENDLVPSLHSAFPQGSLWRERPPPRGGKGGARRVTLYPHRCRTSGEKRGVAPSTSAPSRTARCHAGRKGKHARHSLASLCRKGRGKSVLSRVPCGVSGKSRATTARGAPSERKALWWSKACHPLDVTPPLWKGDTHTAASA